MTRGRHAARRQTRPGANAHRIADPERYNRSYLSARRSRAMRAITVLVVILAACGARRPGITIAITADGYVKVDGKAVTLDELGTWLAARREPLEELEWGGKASSIPVLLEAEDDALWGHVHWVMVVLAEQKLWRLSLPGGREAPLPRDAGIVPSGAPPDSRALVLRVVVLEGGVHALGDRRSRDIEELGRWIDAEPRDGIPSLIGGIAAEPRATWRQVRPLFDLLRHRGARRIEFQGGIPLPSDRMRSPLPPPTPGDLSWSGAFVVDYWSGPDVYEEPADAAIEEPEPDLPGEELVALLDSHRAAHQLDALAADDTLRRTASLHAREMDRLGYFGHFSPVPGNHSPSDRLATQGWPEERRHAELLAKADTAEAAFEALLAKPENAKVLADPAFRHAGVARSGDCWVVLLGAER